MALGIITRIMKAVSEASVREAILTRVPKGTEDVNQKAFDLGLAMGGEMRPLD